MPLSSPRRRLLHAAPARFIVIDEAYNHHLTRRISRAAAVATALSLETAAVIAVSHHLAAAA